MKATPLLFATMLVATGAFAASPSHEAAIIQLLEITEAKQLLDQNEETIHQQMQQAFDATLQLRNTDIADADPALRKEVELMLLDASELIREVVSYEAMEAPMVDIYAAAFSETEVYQLIEFYKTPVGQLTIERMPIIMQEVQKMVQDQMMVVLPKLEAVVREFEARVEMGAQERQERGEE